MAVINDEEIAGYRFKYKNGCDDEIVCRECVSEDEKLSSTSRNLLLNKHYFFDDILYFCDRCKKRINKY
jgi:hypothetical protein